MINKEQSPTVKFSSDKDPDWFEKNGGDYGYGNYPESRYDNDGYDKRGYNEYIELELMKINTMKFFIMKFWKISKIFIFLIYQKV